MNNWIWISYPIVAAFLWASVNHLDKYLLSKYCKQREIGGLVIFSGLIAIPVLVVLLVIDPSILSNAQFPSMLFVVLSGACYMFAIIPYLYALEEDEVSTVAPQMILITVLTLALGYLFLGEKLTLIQFFGMAIIILSSLLISLDIGGILNTRFKSKIFSLMLIATTLMALNAFLFKYVALESTFISTVFWLHVGYLLVTIFIFVVIRQYRDQFYKLVRINPAGIITVNAVSEIITIIGNILVHYATLLVPIALAEVVVEGIQPFFVLLISIIIIRIYPWLGEKNLQRKQILQKLISVTLMAIGIILINF